MTTEQKLKSYILDKYKSVRSFTQVIGVPYSTVDNIFKRGIGGTGVSTIIKVCNGLDIDVTKLAQGEIVPSKKDPDQESLDQGTDSSLNDRVQYLADFFEKMGFIEPGGDISDRDLEFSKALIDLIAAHFKK